MAATPPTTASLAAELTLEEQVTLLSGHDVWHTATVERLGIGAIKVTDGPNGARGDSTTGATAVCLPATIGLAATFDRDLAAEVGRLLGLETERKGAHVLLAPTINMARHPLGGRNFESFGEDPVLTAELAVAYVNGVQSTGVGACAKHFVANDVEYARMTVSSEVDEAVLREVYLAPFEAVVEAGVWSVMASYPKLNGQHCTEHEWLLTTLLRHEWGFDGLVMSDWGATHHRSRPVAAGLDLEMPGPARALGPELLAAVDDGEIEPATVADRAARVVQLAARTGRLDRVELEPERSIDDAEDRRLARRVATDGMVLVRNRALLPLVAADLTSVAVIGPNADPGVIQGGGSAQVPAHYHSSPVEGLAAALGPDVAVDHHRGCLAHRYLPPPDPDHWLPLGDDDGAEGRPLRLEIFAGADLDDELISTRSARSVAAFLHGHQRRQVGSQRWTGRLRVDVSGRHRFGVLAVGRSRVLVDGAVVADNWTAPQPGDGFFQHATAEVVGEVELTAGSEAEVVVEWSVGVDAPLVGLRFGHLPPIDENALLDEAVEMAAEASAAVVVVGLTNEWETEGHDRLGFGLPGRQDELIARVTAANPRTVVVVNAGSPVDAPWLDDVGAVLMAWYPGQEFGNALAEVLLGRAEPGGRMPLTWPRSLADTPFELPELPPGPPAPGLTLGYEEGLLIGHRSYDRRGVEPLVPFGFGLGYTTFALGPASVDSSPGGVVVTVPVTNSGDRAGKVVAQVYAEEPSGGLEGPAGGEADGGGAAGAGEGGAGAAGAGGGIEERPPRPLRVLAGFGTAVVEAGGEASVAVELSPRALRRWDRDAGEWRPWQGPVALHVGLSSRHLDQVLEVQL